MTPSDTTSHDTASSTATEISNKASDDFDPSRDIPTTEEDIRVLRELREPQLGKNLLPYIDELLNVAQWEHIEPRRTTAKGRKPFELD